MSKIVVTIDSTVSNSVLMDLKRVTDLSLTEIRQSVGSGQPLVNFLLFNNDHDEISQKLRGLISVLSSNSVESSLFELRDNEDLDSVNRDRRRVPPEGILRLLAQRERDMEEFA
jgi:hypothetical protein